MANTTTSSGSKDSSLFVLWSRYLESDREEIDADFFVLSEDDKLRIIIMSSELSHYGSLALHETNSENDVGEIEAEVDSTMVQDPLHQYPESRDDSSPPVGKMISREIILFLAMVCGFMLSFPPAGTSTMSVFRGGSTLDLTVEETMVVSSKNFHSKTSSPFFEHVLEWIEMPLDETPTNYDSSSFTTKSNHYKGSIEFCSDPSKALYGYGPVGNCVPGKAAPLIRMKPKHFYHLTLYNNAHIDTNLHTHGLHVSGVGTVDDVTRVAKPGECLTYEYYILDDADVGTFWYHPHRHPLVTKSAYGGAYGMLIVDESTTVENDEHEFYPQHLSNFLTTNEILLQFSSMYNKKLENATRSNKVNGQDSLDMSLMPGTHYYFRVSSVVYSESVNYIEFDPPDACDVRVVAYDGVYRSKIPGPKHTPRHMMTVSSRVDLAVQCSQSADIHFHQGKKTNTSKMVKIHVNGNQVDENNADGKYVSLLQSTALPSSPYWDVNAETTWKPRRPYYMPDLTTPDYLVDEYWSVSMDDYFVNGTKGVSVNQVVWDPETSLRTFDMGQLIEYQILLSETHPYHAHINRMQIVEPGGCGGRFEEGEYFDTIVQTKNTTSGGCTVRTKFFDFSGRVVIHCHRFGHEDKGMMTWIDVLGGHGHGVKAAPATSCAAVL